MSDSIGPTQAAAVEPITGATASTAPCATDAPANSEARLLGEIFERWHAYLAPAADSSKIPAAFLGALTANESGGDPYASRFEPGVYAHLKAVAAGESPIYAGITGKTLNAEIQGALNAKTLEFHARYLTLPFGATNAEQFKELAGEQVRQLATSWGFTQIMGYHMVGQNAPVLELQDAGFHYRFAVKLLAEFIAEFKLDPTRDFEAMFRCWNTGRPDGRTFDPAYVENGLRRLKLYREAAGAEGAG